MKTSLLISSIAALCLLVTFAEAPRRHGEEKMNLSVNENISILSMNKVTMLPGVEITADRKKETEITVPVAAADFSYLKFDVTEFLATDAATLAEAELLPEAAKTDFSYLKFNISDFISESKLTGDEIIELPENEIVPSDNSVPEPVAREFEYLRFNVNNYMNKPFIDAVESEELPLPESGTGDKSNINPMESTSELSYIKFDVNKFYDANNLSTEKEFELPEK